MARPLDCLNQHPLVPGTGPCYTLRNNPSLFRNEPLKPFLILIVNVEILVFTKAAYAFLPDLLTPRTAASCGSSAPGR